VKALLDTHVFLWWVTDDRRLSARACEVIADPAVDLFLSAASVWEIAIKTALGKLHFDVEMERFIPLQLERNEVRVLPVELLHALRVAALPGHHGDPFDRFLVAQCQVEEMPIVTGDEVVRRYGVQVIW